VQTNHAASHPISHLLAHTPLCLSLSQTRAPAVLHAAIVDRLHHKRQGSSDTARALFRPRESAASGLARTALSLKSPSSRAPANQRAAPVLAIHLSENSPIISPTRSISRKHSEKA
jgi:hypothetical protein